MAQQQQVSVIGVFYDQKQLQAVRQELTKMGVAADHIHTNPSGDAAHPGEKYEDKGFWESLKEMFTGDDEHAAGADYYAEAARRGGYVLTVTTDEGNAQQVQNVMQRYGAADAEKQVARWKQEGWGGYDRNKSMTAANLQSEHKAREAGGETMQVVEEQLDVGKRQVQRGGVRLVRRVTEKPVEANVTLREEHVKVERHNVGRDLTAEEAERAFAEGDRTIEATETAEEAVVGKTARVVEEVSVGKTATQREETVRDTVRRSDVEVEKIEADATAAGTATKNRRD